MKLFLVEDEAPARDRLIETIRRVDPGATLVGVATSVREASAWLTAHPPPDLLLLDVQLSDGLSFELFAQGAVTCPAIFATAYDEFVLDAFKANAIDYVLKPVSDAALASAFASYRRLRTHFGAAVATAAAQVAAAPRPPRQRLLAKKGDTFVSLRIDDIGYFVSLDKSTWAIDRGGHRHLVDLTLAELDEELDSKGFFRINRQLIVGAAAVLGFRPSGKGRLSLQLVPAASEAVTVTQERAAAFRAWLAS